MDPIQRKLLAEINNRNDELHDWDVVEMTITTDAGATVGLAAPDVKFHRYRERVSDLLFRNTSPGHTGPERSLKACAIKFEERMRDAAMVGWSPSGTQPPDQCDGTFRVVNLRHGTEYGTASVRVVGHEPPSWATTDG